LSDPARRDKAQATHERALCALDLPELDEGDYILGWKDIPGAYRYCHSFSDTEIDQLITSTTRGAPGASRPTSEPQLIARFTADGRTNNLNTYLILQNH